MRRCEHVRNCYQPDRCRDCGAFLEFEIDLDWENASERLAGDVRFSEPDPDDDEKGDEGGLRLVRERA